MERVPALLEEMKQNQVEPDIITYSTIVKGYCLSGDVDRGFAVLQEMQKDGKYAPDEILYNSLLDGCAKQHRVEEALRLLEDMRASGVAPSNYTLSIAVKLLGRARRLNQAFAIVEEMCSAHGLRANVHVYTCLVQACFQNRQAERALAVHDTMLSEAGCQPDQKFYSSRAWLRPGRRTREGRRGDSVRAPPAWPQHGNIQGLSPWGRGQGAGRGRYEVERWWPGRPGACGG